MKIHPDTGPSNTIPLSAHANQFSKIVRTTCTSTIKSKFASFVTSGTTFVVFQALRVLFQPLQPVPFYQLLLPAASRFVMRMFQCLFSRIMIPNFTGNVRHLDPDGYPLRFNVILVDFISVISTKHVRIQTFGITSVAQKNQLTQLLMFQQL